MTTSIEVAELEDQLKKFPEYDSKYSLEVNIYTILYNNGGKEQLQGALMLGGMMTGSMAVTIATAVGDNALDGKELITPDVLLAALVSSKLKVRGAVKGPVNVPIGKGSGPAPGVLGANSSSTSVAAIKNYYPKEGAIEFVFDPKTNTFLVGEGKHAALANTINADTSTVVGGIFKRGPNVKYSLTKQAAIFGRTGLRK
ncbi:polymorphic toxin type 43 domain-containing protein [Acetonema longum]|nr:polymorphic toxin type 43 domain-containing protein [Acetonema longum]